MSYSWVQNVSIEKPRDNRKTGYRNIILEILRTVNRLLFQQVSNKYFGTRELPGVPLVNKLKGIFLRETPTPSFTVK